LLWSAAQAQPPGESSGAEILFETVVVSPGAEASSFGSGWVRFGGTWGGAYRSGGQDYDLRATVETADDRTRVVVSVEGAAGTLLHEDLDLSEWVGAHVVLPSAQGERRVLNVLPRLIPPPLPPLDLGAGSGVDPSLTRWSFHESPVILDDRHYVGRIVELSGDSIAWLEVPGEIYLRLSLRPFEGATPTGLLRGGRIEIDGPDGRSLEIFQVGVGESGLFPAGRDVRVYGAWEPARLGRDEAAERERRVLARWRADLDPAEIEVRAGEVATGYSLSGYGVTSSGR
jgi:hypothetical protein